MVVDKSPRRQSAIDDGIARAGQTMGLNASPPRETVVVSVIRPSLGAGGPRLVIRRREVGDPVRLVASLRLPLRDSRLLRPDHVAVIVVF